IPSAMRWAALSAPADDSGSAASSKRTRRASRPSPPSGSTASTARCTTWLSVTGSGSVGMRWCLPLPAGDRARQLVLGHRRAPRDVELLGALVQLLLGSAPLRLRSRPRGETAQGLGDRLLLCHARGLPVARRPHTPRFGGCRIGDLRGRHAPPTDRREPACPGTRSSRASSPRSTAIWTAS